MRTTDTGSERNARASDFWRKELKTDGLHNDRIDLSARTLISNTDPHAKKQSATKNATNLNVLFCYLFNRVQPLYAYRKTDLYGKWIEEQQRAR